MSSPPPASPPGSNVTPMWGGSGPPWLRPPAQPPGCFSQLYALNQCYDDILAMKAILAKVVCDLATNDPEFQACLAAGIGKVGAGTPLTGVTDGSSAAPGIVGEFLSQQQDVTVATGTNTQVVSSLILPPGDWDMWSWCTCSFGVGWLDYYLPSIPTGFSNDMQGFFEASGTLASVVTIGKTTRATISAPTLLAFTFTTNSATGGTAIFQVEARRAR